MKLRCPRVHCPCITKLLGGFHWFSGRWLLFLNTRAYSHFKGSSYSIFKDIVLTRYTSVLTVKRYTVLQRIIVINCFLLGRSFKRYFNYEGSGDVQITCSESEVIKITNVKLQNQPTDCPREACYLTDLDRKYIDTCTGSSNCTIPIDSMSSCINDKGFFNVEYTCQCKNHNLVKFVY